MDAALVARDLEIPLGRQRQGTSLKRRIIFVNRYFFPDYSATSQILGDLAFHLSNQGHTVEVITSRQRYDDPQARLRKKEAIRGVSIDRLPGTRFGRSSLIGRGFDYLSFYVSAWRAILASAHRGDILVAKTDPPLLCVVAMQAARQRRLHFVNWLQDLYPETAIRLGVPFVKGPSALGLLRLRDASLRAATTNVVVGEGMAQILRQRGIASRRIEVIPNWCDDEEIRPLTASDNSLRREWGLQNRFVVGYSGNLGRAHEFETVLEAAALLREKNRFVFLFIGGGNKLDELAQLVRKRSLAHLFRFVPYQKRALLKYSLTVPDVHWISLRPELEGLIVPSKFYGIAAAGRPVIAVTARSGEIARLVQQHRCGTIIEPGNGAAFADAVHRLSVDEPALAEMGLRAREMLEARFTRRQAFERWSRLLEGLG